MKGNIIYIQAIDCGTLPSGQTHVKLATSNTDGYPMFYTDEKYILRLPFPPSDYYIIPRNGTWIINGIDINESIKKQIPRKLLNYNKISASGNCPCCNSFLDTYVAYCHSCGQRIQDEEKQEDEE